MACNLRLGTLVKSGWPAHKGSVPWAHLVHPGGLRRPGGPGRGTLQAVCQLLLFSFCPPNCHRRRTRIHFCHPAPTPTFLHKLTPCPTGFSWSPLGPSQPHRGQPRSPEVPNPGPSLDTNSQSKPVPPPSNDRLSDELAFVRFHVNFMCGYRCFSEITWMCVCACVCARTRFLASLGGFLKKKNCGCIGLSPHCLPEFLSCNPQAKSSPQARHWA